MKSNTKALIEPYFWTDKERIKNIHKFDTREHPKALLAKVKSKHLAVGILLKMNFLTNVLPTSHGDNNPDAMNPLGHNEVASRDVKWAFG